MAPTNRQRIDEALDLLRDGLTPYFQQLITASRGAGMWEMALAASDRYGDAGDNVDISRLVNIFHEFRNDIFRDAMGRTGVNLMHEVQDIRNKEGHQHQFNTADTIRALDTISRLLEIAGAPEQAEQVQRSHEQLLRSLYAEQVRSESRKRVKNLNSQGSAALVPWREVVMPHEDVRTGNLKEAEFAADLYQVQQGKAGPEYGDPQEFFRRTYLTEGLTNLLTGAFDRLHNNGGDPVLELQTNFGGGKTHSMIALYHIASGIAPASLPGLDPLVQKLKSADPLFVQRAVLVGTKLSANEPRRKSDSVTTRTMWGELAWQLAGEQGYRLVEESDKSGHAPGGETLQELFRVAGPSLILIDEWVAFIRGLYHRGDTIAAAGSFEANLTFAQALTEAVAATPQVLLAASLPTSEIEVGGVGGEQALKILKHTFSRVRASWRAATADESFEIVRRRLFQEVDDPRKRDSTIQLFLRHYQESGTEYPSKVHSAEYRKRMEAAYPFHPELFDLLFEVWGSMESFQRTRGVLRLMANVVHTLWERGDASPLIMPANVPLDAVGVVTEMGGYLPDSWSAVIEHDIDGESALSLALDKENGNFDKVSATRRVARSIFLGSAPTFRSDNRGIDDRQIRLGVIQPGETASIFGDALRNFANRATYLYTEHGRYWFSTQPSITQLFQERRDQLTTDDIDHALEELLRSHQSKRGIFDRVHVAPLSSSDVADTPEITLVMLGPGSSHVRRQIGGESAEESAAVSAALALLESRGDGKRQHRNSLIFLAPDNGNLTKLREVMGDHIAWKEIVDARERNNLDPQQLQGAEARRDEAARTVEARLRDTWIWLLAPRQDPIPGSLVEWDQLQLRGIGPEDALPVAAGKRAESEEMVVSSYAPIMMRRAIDDIPTLRNGWTHIRFGDLQSWFADYLYLQRLQNPDVLRKTVEQGLAWMDWLNETFAYAELYDEQQLRYLGLKAGPQEAITVTLSKDSLIVHPSVAQRQMLEDEREVATTPEPLPGETSAPPATTSPPEKLPTRYFGSVTLNPQTISSNVKEISQEVLAPLQGIYGARVSISLEIEISVADGIPAEAQQTVRQKSAELHFDQSDFSQ